MPNKQGVKAVRVVMDREALFLLVDVIGLVTCGMDMFKAQELEAIKRQAGLLEGTFETIENACKELDKLCDPSPTGMPAFVVGPDTGSEVQ